MDNDLRKFIGFGLAVGGLLVAIKSFDNKFVAIEHQGLTFGSGLAILGLGLTVVARFEDTESKARALFG
jgi:hypothetical protein